MNGNCTETKSYSGIERNDSNKGTVLSEILGADVPELLRQDGSRVATTMATNGKDYVLLYFSASWCSPCRIFTPKLAAFHEFFSKTHNFEVVFISQDHEKNSMLAYYHNPRHSRLAIRGGEGSHGNWLAVPYEHARAAGARLMRLHRVGGIPSVLVFDLRSGALVTVGGRALVMRHFDTAAGFPWADGGEDSGAGGFTLCHLVIVVFVYVILLYLWG